MEKSKKNPWAVPEQEPKSWRHQLMNSDQDDMITMPKTLSTIAVVGGIIGIVIWLITMPQ
jgi:hypothetical protein